MKKSLNYLLSISISFLGIATSYSQNIDAIPKKEIPILENEKWWGGATLDGRNMPFTEGKLTYNQAADCKTNQVAPLFISSKGRYIWSEAYAKLGNEIYKLAEECAVSGEPMVRNLEYEYPGFPNNFES